MGADDSFCVSWSCSTVPLSSSSCCPLLSRPFLSGWLTVAALLLVLPCKAEVGQLEDKQGESPPDPKEQSEAAPEHPAPVQETPRFDEVEVPAEEISSEMAGPIPPPFTTIVLVEGIAKYGAIALAISDPLQQSAVESDTDSAGLIGAQATLGLMPGGSTFMLAGRLRVGSYIRAGEAIANMGAEMLFGANFLRKSDGRSFSYAMAGMGVEYMPSNNQDLLTLHAGGGSVVRGINFGGGLEIGANDEFAVVMFGFHVGWGRLFY